MQERLLFIPRRSSAWFESYWTIVCREIDAEHGVVTFSGASEFADGHALPFVPPMVFGDPSMTSIRVSVDWKPNGMELWIAPADVSMDCEATAKTWMR
jgi:hypothetical protein